MTRVGLLECDHVDDRFRDIAGDYADMFAALLPHVDLVGYDAVNGVLPKEPEECDGWLLTGSRFSAYDDEPWIAALSAFVRGCDGATVPTAGICFGHQLLAQALGGRVERAASGWGVGAHVISTADDDRWRLLFMHQDQVVALPPAATVAGRTDHCPIAMFRIGASSFGIQAHPEFTREYELALIDARVGRLGVDAAASARASLDGPTDEPAVAAALTNFFQSGR